MYKTATLNKLVTDWDSFNCPKGVCTRQVPLAVVSACALLWFKDFHLSDVCVSTSLVVGHNDYLEEESSHWPEEGREFSIITNLSSLIIPPFIFIHHINFNPILRLVQLSDTQLLKIYTDNFMKIS